MYGPFLLSDLLCRVYGEEVEDKAATYAQPMSELLPAFRVVPVLPLAHFLGQIGHESNRLKYSKEIWGPTKWQKRYEGHTGLGNTEPGDGYRYRGRGLIQVTGRYNYTSLTEFAQERGYGVDFVERPDLVATPKWAVFSALWYWQSQDLNTYARQDDVETVTRLINGPGMLGLDDRKELTQKACREIERDQEMGRVPAYRNL